MGSCVNIYVICNSAFAFSIDSFFEKVVVDVFFELPALLCYFIFYFIYFMSFYFILLLSIVFGCLDFS